MPLQHKLDRDKNFNLTWTFGLDRRKQIFVLFNDCQDMLQDVDEIISQPFPVNWVFNMRLTNMEVGLICIVHIIMMPQFQTLQVECKPLNPNCRVF